MKERKGSRAAIGDLAAACLRGHPAFSANPLGDWGEVVGEQTARYSQPVSLKQKVLRVVVFDSVWKHHLDINSGVLLENINRGRRELLVEKIVVRVGEVPESAPPLNPNSKLLDKLEAKRSRAKKRKKPPLQPLTPEEEELLKSLADPELRRIGKRLLRRLPSEETL